MCRRSRPAHAQTGASAVEAGLITTFLMPLVMGVLGFGSYFWHLQQVDELAVRIPQGSVVGTGLTCQELVDRVKATALQTVSNTSGTSYPTLGLDDIVVEVIEVLPTVGAVVTVEVQADAGTSLTWALPDDGRVSAKTTLFLDGVTLSTTSC